MKVCCILQIPKGICSFNKLMKFSVINKRKSKKKKTKKNKEKETNKKKMKKKGKEKTN